MMYRDDVEEKGFGWWMYFGLVFAYVIVEWIYNQHLLQVAMLSHVTPESFNYTERFGKMIASFGINLLFWKIFQYRKTFFIIGLFVVYFGLTIFFNYIIHSRSNEFRYESQYLMMDRVSILNRDKIKLLTADDPKKDTWEELAKLLSQPTQL